MIKNGRTFRKDVKIVRRGLKEFDKILHGQMRHIFARGILVSCISYIPVIMSSVIINELVTKQRFNHLLFLSIFAAFIMFVLTIMKIIEEKKIAVGFSHLFSSHEIYLTNRSYILPYESLESNEVRELREQVSGSINVSGAGMASLYWDTDIVFTNLCSALIAIVLCFWYVKEIVIWDYSTHSRLTSSIVVILALFALVIVCSVVSCKMTSKRFDSNFEVFTNGSKYNRYGEFYTIKYLSNENAALDTRIFGQKETIINESQEKCYSKFADGQIKEMKAINKYDGIKLLCTCLCGSIVYLLIAQQATLGAISAGSIVMIYAAVTMLINSLSEIAQIMTDLRNNNVHLLNFFKYMDLEDDSELVDDQKTADEVSSTADTIEFRNVSFKYPGSDNLVLENINLTISKGEKIAIVGENGSGKTTLIKLLCRLYQPTQGTILLNGKDIKSYPFSEYIKHISTVFQDFSLFAFSVAENIAASNNYDENKVLECLEKVGLGKKISTYDKGIRQPLLNGFDEEGVDLSGGEAQKVAIARAIYKDTDIMILDEPTSALDPLAEHENFKKFYEITSGKTAIFISHRLSSCRMADRIIVLDCGKVIQSGSHEALLLKRDEKYYEMWNAQAQYYS